MTYAVFQLRETNTSVGGMKKNLRDKGERSRVHLEGRAAFTSSISLGVRNADAFDSVRFLKWVRMWNTGPSLATSRPALLHTFIFSDAVCYTATSTNTTPRLFVFSVRDSSVINTTFVNKPRKRNAGDLGRHSTATQLLFTLQIYFKVAILCYLCFFVVWGPFKGKV